MERGADAGEKMKAAVAFHHPKYMDCGRLRFPMLHQSLKGWTKFVRKTFRWPMLEEACGAISGMVIQQGLKRMALFTMLTSSTYMRLVESRTLRTINVVPAIPDAAHNFSCKVLVLSPSDPDAPSAKTGGHD